MNQYPMIEETEKGCLNINLLPSQKNKEKPSEIITDPDVHDLLREVELYHKSSADESDSDIS